MFAYLIWDNIRNDSKKKAKLYDLPKELQVFTILFILSENSYYYFVQSIPILISS
jgi:hypothetical protein